MNTEFIDRRFSHITIGKSTITKVVLAEAVMERITCSRTDAMEIIDTMFDEMVQAMEQGRGLKFSNFGTFELREENLQKIADFIGCSVSDLKITKK